MFSIFLGSGPSPGSGTIRIRKDSECDCRLRDLAPRSRA